MLCVICSRLNVVVVGGYEANEQMDGQEGSTMSK